MGDCPIERKRKNALTGVLIQKVSQQTSEEEGVVLVGHLVSFSQQTGHGDQDT